MELSIGLQRDLDNLAQLITTLYSVTIKKQQEAAELVNANDFSGLIEKFHWQAEISKVLSDILITNNDTDLIRYTKPAYIVVRDKLMDLIDGFVESDSALIEQGFLDIKELIDALESNNIFVIKDIVQYMSSKIYMCEGLVDLTRGYIKIDYTHSQLPSINIDMSFDDSAIKQWLVNHMLLEEGGCLTHKMDAVSVIKHNGTAEPIEVSFMFKSEDLEPWMQEHTLVQDGHLMFIE